MWKRPVSVRASSTPVWELKVPLRVILQRVQNQMSQPTVFWARAEVALVQIAPVASINEVLVGFVPASRDRDEMVNRQLAAHVVFRRAAVAALTGVPGANVFVLGVSHVLQSPTLRN